MSEKGLFQAILECRCPQCRKGKMFEYSAVNPKKFGHMTEECPECGLRFEREPGFFYGAMYISYMLSVGIFLTTFVTLYFLADNPSLTVYIVTVGVVSALSYSLNFRYSRVIFINIFGGIKYDPSKASSKSVS